MAHYRTEWRATHQAMDNASRSQPLGADGLRIGERLRFLREAAGMSQRALALATVPADGHSRPAGAGITAAYISRIERGDRLPSVYVIRALALALDVSPNVLEGGEESDQVRRLEAEVARLRAAREKK